MSTIVQMMTSINQSTFDQTHIAFAGKSDAELRKAYLMFRLLNAPAINRAGSWLINTALRFHLPVEGLIKKTIFRQFCGGESIEDCIPQVNRLAAAGIGSILDYSVEGDESEEVFDYCLEEILLTISYSAAHRFVPFCVFKPSGMARFALLAKVAAGESLTRKEEDEFSRAHNRIRMVCEAAFEKGVKLLVDAEHYEIQDIIDRLTVENMQQFNREKAIIFNTCQLYRHDKLSSLKADCLHAEKNDYYLGVKLVRGAYMEFENERAMQHGYVSPIHTTRAGTDKAYNDALLFCLENLQSVAFMAGTHNEESCIFLAQEMKIKKIPPSHPHIWFAQLLGMSDHISFNLANAGYNVAKYVPYGKVREVMPYLIRRARENTSVAGQAGREVSLLAREIRRRQEEKKV